MGDGASFGSRNFVGDVFPGIREVDLSGIFNWKLLRGCVDGFVALSFVTFLLFSKFWFVFISLSVSAILWVDNFLLDSTASEDLAKLFLIALGVTMDDGDGNFCVFVGVVGGGCGKSSLVCSGEKHLSSSVLLICKIQIDC